MKFITLLISAILLRNQVKSERTNITVRAANVNSLLEESSSTLFTLQIQQIRQKSEATPAASSGNNLNDFTTSLIEINSENFQPTSTIHLFENKKDTNEIRDEENDKLRFLLDENTAKVKHKNLKLLNKDKIKALPSIWDGCLETYHKEQENIENLKKPSSNDEIKYIKPNYNNVWTKRNINESEAVANWVEKYNTLLRAKTEERRQQKQEIFIPRKVNEAITPKEQTTIKVEPITRDIFEEVTTSLSVTQDTLKTANTIAGFTEDWVETKEETKIRFSGLPQTENYLVPALKIEEGFYPFSFMSNFFLLVYPSESAVGLIKDIVWGKFNFPLSFFQSIKVETTFLGFIVVFYCIALVIPSYLIILGILSLLSRSSDDEQETGALFPETEDSDCNDRVTAVITLLILLLCFVFISGMAVNNEQAYSASEISRNVIRCACSDVASWLSAAARELHYSIVPPIDLVAQAYKDDLRNVESLLGEPIQKAIASESGIDLVLDSLTDIITETEDLSTKISSLRDLSIRAGALASSTSDRIRDISRQIENLKKYCTLKDAPLCDTINTNSLEVKIRFDLILHEQQLLELRALGVENLTRAISTARQEFRALPSAITTQTSQVRTDILKHIEYRRQLVHASSRVFSDIVRHLTASLQTASRFADAALVRFISYDYWRWVVMIACISTFGFVMFLMLPAVFCGCGQAKVHAKRTLQCSVICLGLLSLLLWTLVSGIFLVAGHAEVYMCSALWDSQNYGTLSSLLDRPSPVFANNQGLFDILFQDLENVTIDVSVRDVLRDCERDQPAYVVFQLDKVIDVNEETSYFEWIELQNDLDRFSASIDVGLLKTVSAFFNKLLSEILNVSDVNLAKYRSEYGGPIVGKDLPALADQLENIAAQVTDLTTAARLESLATRTKRVHATNIKPLEQLRAEVVFKLTELELQLQPFRKRLNISLSHIHTAQYYIDNQGDTIARKKISIYKTRLLSHTAGWRTHVLTATESQAARCRPLFTVYSALRSLLCTRYLSSLHGWWVCGSLLGILWCTALTPICVKLWQAYGEKSRPDAMTLSNITSGQQGTPTTVICEGSNWHTPGPPPPPPRNDSW